MKRNLRRILTVLGIVGIMAVNADAFAAVTVSGTVGTSGKYLVSGMPVTGRVPAMIKLTFENRTAGTNLLLCAGTTSDFSSGKCPIMLSTSGGPGFQFLTIVDMAALSGKVLYVKRAVGATSAAFTLTVE